LTNCGLFVRHQLLHAVKEVLEQDERAFLALRDVTPVGDVPESWPWSQLVEVDTIHEFFAVTVSA